MALSDLHVNPEGDFPTPTEPTTFYVVCSTPRSGSTLLGLLFQKTGRMGLPLEYFNPYNQLKDLCARFNASSVPEVLPPLFSARTSENGVFGFKAHFDQFACLRQAVSLKDAFPGLKFIYIDRRDTLGQIISYARAVQNQQWITDGEKSAKDPTFNPEMIEKQGYALIKMKEVWEKFFSFHGISPFRIMYEDLCEHPQGICRGAARHIGLEDADKLIFSLENVASRKQRDALSEEWKEKIHTLSAL